MSEPRRGRPTQKFTISRIRLIGFHNFVNETIEIPDGGHLFLLGDNAAGKTTVIDAIHLILTGTMGIELNAAARLARGRDAGRTLQGLVLRFDVERGVMNEGGGIAYAILELACVSEDIWWLVGIGMEATTMDADVLRWGFITRGRLEDVTVVGGDEGNPCPLPRDSLRDVLPKLDLYAKISDYRRALADRFFGDPDHYEETCRFWTMAKAYREIVNKASDFAGLFARLLPAPNKDTFAEILKSASALDELEDTLKNLGDQCTYVIGLAAIVGEIRDARETISRYRWLRNHRLLAESENKLERTSSSITATEAAEISARVELADRKGQAARARDALLSAQAGSPEGLGARLRNAEVQFAADEQATKLRQAEVESANHDIRVLQERIANLRARVRSEWDEKIREAEIALAALDIFSHPFIATRTALQAEAAIACDDTHVAPLLSVPVACFRELEDVRSISSEAARKAERGRDICGERHEKACEALRQLEARTEELPEIRGFVAAQAALSAANISACPLYEALEPKRKASQAVLASLELLLGDAALSAFVVNPGNPSDLKRARSLIIPHEGTRLVVGIKDKEELPELPPWILDLFSSTTDTLALRALAAILAQPVAFGVIAPPDALGDLEHRGVLMRTHELKPRLLGIDARRRMHRERVSRLRGEVESAETALVEATAAHQAATDRLTLVSRLEAALRDLRAVHFVQNRAEFVQARSEKPRLEAQQQRVSREFDKSRKRCDKSGRLVAALRAQADAVGLQEIERRLAGLQKDEADARREEDAALEAHLNVKNSLDTLTRTRDSLMEEIRAMRVEGENLAKDLRAHLTGSLAEADDRVLEHYVVLTQRGEQFKSVKHIEERLQSAERDEAAKIAEIEGDGSRGVRSLAWAGRFGFTWHSAEGRVVDRRNEPLANVRAQIEKTIEDQRGVVNAKTHELMDKVVMGALAQELQGHVEHLKKTIRDMDKLLSGLEFGKTRYQFKVTARPERAELVELVRKVSLLDSDSRLKFRQFIDDRLDEIKRQGGEREIPELLDYRRWFDYRLSISSGGPGETELTRELRALGSGGEQGVPNYLLVLALARLMFDKADARLCPLLFDEAFYGIDAGRRDQLLRFATDLGLQLFVASPDQDGVTPSVRRTTTLFLVKDTECDVHLAPYHYWNDSRESQRSLFEARGTEPLPGEALCLIGDPRQKE